jgi:hypothetical protein
MRKTARESSIGGPSMAGKDGALDSFIDALKTGEVFGYNSGSQRGKGGPRVRTGPSNGKHVNLFVRFRERGR